MNTENNQSNAVGFPPGTKIGKYEIVSRLGMGGQAIVYKAYDSLLDRYVAIKQISSHLAENAEFLERFRKEAQILARLASSQPALVTIHELIQEERGLFIVMEFVPGHTLETTLSDNPGPVETKAVLQVLWRLAAGLHAVHSAGVVHRDIKPGNIIIGDGLKVKIADFGVAASSSGQTSMVLGTTKYMAPELYGGKTSDARVDMYSLGFIAYEMLLGRAKFNEVFADVVRDKHSEALRWMKWHGNEQVTAPPLNEVNSAIPRILADIVATMMAKNPDQRFASMEQLGRAIKTSFSPRAQASRDGGAAENGSPKPAMGPGEAAAPVLEGDEELEVSADSAPPATAPLPKRKLGLKTKLILAGAAALVLVGVLVTVEIKNLMAAAAVQAAAAKDFDSADAAYKAGRYKDAVDGFAKVIDRYRDTDQSAKSAVLLCMARARQAIENASSADNDAARQPFWVKASSESDDAKKAWEQAQRQKNNLGPWAGTVDREMEEFRAARISSRLFWAAIDKASAALDAKNFDEARRILSVDLADGQIHRTPREGKSLQKLLDKIDVADFETQFKTHMTAGQEKIKGKEYQAASVELDQASSLLKDPLVSKVPADVREQYQRELNAAWDDLSKFSDYAKAMRQVEVYLQDGKKGQALEERRKAYQIQPSPELDDQIKTLQADIALEQGRAYANDGKFKEARAKFEEALKFKPIQDAKAELAKLDRSEKLQVLLTKASAAFDKGDLKDAADLYKQASDIDPADDDTKAKFKASQYGWQLSEAQTLAKEKKYDKALPLLEELRRLYPDKITEIDGVDGEVKQSRDYEQAVARGDARYIARQWSQARAEYVAAQKFKDTPEVAGMIKRTHYSENLEKGQAAMDQGDFLSAKGFFTVAKGYNDTPEVEKLLAAAQEKLKESGK